MIEDRSRLAGVLALLALASAVALSASLHFPEVLLDPPSFAASFLSSNALGVIVSLVLLFAQGVVLVMLARPSLTGVAAGVCTALSAVFALMVGPLAFVGGAIVGPLLLAIWTLGLRDRGVLRWLGALGLLVTCARSLVWFVNALMPEDEGFYVTSAVLTVAALLGQPLWACWLLRTSGWFAKPIVVGLITAVVVPAQAILMIASTPTPETDDVPAVPSAAGHVRYAVSLALRQQFALPTSHEDLLAQRKRETDAPVQVPSDVTLENVDAGGVPAERLCVRGASTERMLLNLPGGGFIMPPGNNSRRLAANVSRATGACVLMLRYRLAPEHPFPAAVDDGVRAYRWLRAQGIPASRIAIFGDSAGGNLTVTTALALRDNGDELPAALVSVSGVMDFTRSSHTWRTKAGGETLIVGSTADYTIRSYASAADLRHPLLSPLHADLTGLPPTLLMMGSQEVLLGDAIRMAGRLREARVDVRLEIWPGMPHAWTGARKDTMETRLAVQHMAAFMSRRIS